MKSYYGYITYDNNKIESVEFITNKSFNSIKFTVINDFKTEIKIQKIYGYFNSLGYVTFLNCHYEKNEKGCAVNYYEYSIEFVLVGGWIENIASPIFSKIILAIPKLCNWTRLSSVEESRDNINFLEYEEVLIHKSDKMTVNLIPACNINRNYVNNTTLISEFINVKINFSTPKTYTELVANIKEIKKLFLFLANIDTNSSTKLFTKESNEAYDFFWDGNKSIGHNDFEILDPSFEEVSPSLDKVIHQWFTQDKIKASIDLILEKLVNNSLSVENHFLKTCFSIEILHRKLGGVKRRNFKDRLRDLKEYFEKILSDSCDTEKYIQKIVDTRNYLVHMDSDTRVEFNEKEIPFAALYIESIIRIKVLELLGLNDAVLNRLFPKVKDTIGRFYERDILNEV